MTASGRLLLYTPPGNTSTYWRLAIDLTTHHASLLHLHETTPKTTPKTTPTPEPQPKKSKSTKSAKSSKKAQSSEKGRGGNGRGQRPTTPIATNGAGSPEGCDGTEPPRPKRVKPVKPVSGAEVSGGYRLRRLAVACTCCAWLPTLLQVGGEVVGVIAVATRMGHVTLLGVKLPIVLGK